MDIIHKNLCTKKPFHEIYYTPYKPKASNINKPTIYNITLLCSIIFKTTCNITSFLHLSVKTTPGKKKSQKILFEQKTLWVNYITRCYTLLLKRCNKCYKKSVITTSFYALIFFHTLYFYG